VLASSALKMTAAAATTRLQSVITF
jgi:hypothetical protein